MRFLLLALALVLVLPPTVFAVPPPRPPPAPPAYLLLSCPGLIANYTTTVQAELVIAGAQTCAPSFVAANLTLPNGTIWFYNYQNYPPARFPNDPTLPTCLGSNGPHLFRIYAVSNGTYALNASYVQAGTDVMSSCTYRAAGVRVPAKVPDAPFPAVLALALACLLWARARARFEAPRIPRH